MVEGIHENLLSAKILTPSEQNDHGRGNFQDEDGLSNSRGKLLASISHTTSSSFCILCSVLRASASQEGTNAQGGKQL